MGRLRLSWLGELMVILPLMLCVFQLLGLLIGWIVDKIWGGHELDAIVSWFWIGGWLLWLFGCGGMEIAARLQEAASQSS